MMNEEYNVVEPEFFTKMFEKHIPKDVQKHFRKKFLDLKKNPYTGKPPGFDFIREIKRKGFRVYFIIYDEEKTVLLFDQSNKKTQKQVIRKLYENKNNYKNLLKKFKYVKEPSFQYVKSQENLTNVEQLKKDLSALKEFNKLLKNCLKAQEDVKAGRYKVL